MSMHLQNAPAVALVNIRSHAAAELHRYSQHSWNDEGDYIASGNVVRHARIWHPDAPAALVAAYSNKIVVFFFGH